LVTSKTIIAAERQVSVEEGEQKAKDYGVLFIETSAKIGFNIKALFKRVANILPGVTNYQIVRPAVPGQPITTTDPFFIPPQPLTEPPIQRRFCGCG